MACILVSCKKNEVDPSRLGDNQKKAQVKHELSLNLLKKKCVTRKILVTDSDKLSLVQLKKSSEYIGGISNSILKDLEEVLWVLDIPEAKILSEMNLVKSTADEIGGSKLINIKGLQPDWIVKSKEYWNVYCLEPPEKTISLNLVGIKGPKKMLPKNLISEISLSDLSRLKNKKFLREAKFNYGTRGKQVESFRYGFNGREIPKDKKLAIIYLPKNDWNGGFRLSNGSVEITSLMGTHAIEVRRVGSLEDVIEHLDEITAKGNNPVDYLTLSGHGLGDLGTGISLGYGKGDVLSVAQRDKLKILDRYVAKQGHVHISGCSVGSIIEENIVDVVSMNLPGRVVTGATMKVSEIDVRPIYDDFGMRVHYRGLNSDYTYQTVFNVSDLAINNSKLRSMIDQAKKQGIMINGKIESPLWFFDSFQNKWIKQDAFSFTDHHAEYRFLYSKESQFKYFMSNADIQIRRPTDIDSVPVEPSLLKRVNIQNLETVSEFFRRIEKGKFFEDIDINLKGSDLKLFKDESPPSIRVGRLSLSIDSISPELLRYFKNLEVDELVIKCHSCREIPEELWKIGFKNIDLEATGVSSISPKVAEIEGLSIRPPYGFKVDLSSEDGIELYSKMNPKPSNIFITGSQFQKFASILTNVRVLEIRGPKDIDLSFFPELTHVRVSGFSAGGAKLVGTLGNLEIIGNGKRIDIGEANLGTLKISAENNDDLSMILSDLSFGRGNISRVVISCPQCTKLDAKSTSFKTGELDLTQTNIGENVFLNEASVYKLKKEDEGPDYELNYDSD